METMTDNSTSTPFLNTKAPLSSNVSQNRSLDEYAQLKQSLHTMSAVIYCLAFVLGVLGNGVVIWVTGFKMKKTINTVWLLNLAVADFLFTALLPFSVAYIVNDFSWSFGKFMCKLNSTISFLNMFASVYILVVISVDRCVSVVWPVWAQNHRSVRKACCVSLGVWVLALSLSAPYFIFRDTAKSKTSNNVIFCYINYAFSDDYVTPSVNQLRQFRHQAMTITRFLLGFVVPFTIIVCCYAVIIHRLRNRTFAHQSGRTFKIIAAIITTFFLCWAPYHIMTIIEMVKWLTPSPSKTLNHVISVGSPIATSLAYLNSCLNPILYVFMGHDFKDKICKSVLKILENAFQEDATHCHSYTNSTVLSRSKEKSVSDAEV